MLIYLEAILCSIFFLKEAWRLYNISNPIINHWALPIIILLYIFSFFSIFIPPLFYKESNITKINLSFLIAIIFAIIFRFCVARNIAWQGYMSDSIAFTHYSAELFLDGKNPYLYSMKPTYNRFNIPPKHITLRYDGTTEDKITYPALNFMLIAPFVKMGIKDIRVVMYFLHIIAILLLFLYIKRDYSILFITGLCMLEGMTNLTAGGNTDIVWLILLLFLVPYFNKTILAGVLLGMACSFKQTPWILLPFFCIEYYKNFGIKRPLQFIAIVMLTFLSLNLPFMIHNFSSWFDAITAPFLGGQIMYGCGLNILSQSSVVNWDKNVYTFLFIVVFFTLVIIQIKIKEKSRYIFWFFPAICLYFSYRSLVNYYCYWFILTGLQWFLDEKYKAPHIIS
ncbi:MAG: glycosyltransferase 87 family protein [Candidatus Hydrogenedentota bacterium]